MPPGRTSSRASLPRVLGAGRLDDDVGAIAVTHLGSEQRSERAALRAPADDLGPAAGVADAGGEHQPDRPCTDDRDPVSGSDLRALDAAQAAGERLDHRCDFGLESAGDGEEVHPRDRLRHEQELGIRAVQELERAAALVAGRRVRGDDTAAVGVDAAELVPERARQLAEQHRMPAAERLQVGAVGERDLDPDEHVAGPRLRPWYVLQAKVAGAVEPQRPHGRKTTLSARPFV